MIPKRKHNANGDTGGGGKTLGAYSNTALDVSTQSVDKAQPEPHAGLRGSNEFILTDGSEKGSSKSSMPWSRDSLRKKFNRKTLHKRIPILSWLPKYNASDAIGDVIAGITVGLTVLPQSLAYSNIAGLPPQYGLYGAFIGCFIYIILGSCKSVPMGPTAIQSLLTLQAAGGNIQKSILLCFLAGVVELSMGLLGLGFLIDFVSGPVSSGFTSAVALIIATSQVKDVLGITIQGSTCLQQWISIFSNIKDAKLWDPVLGAICIAVLLIMRKIGMTKVGPANPDEQTKNQKMLNKVMWAIGTCRNAIIVIVCGAVGFALTLQGDSPVNLIGGFPAGLPEFKLPPFSYVNAQNVTVGFFDMCSELGSGLIVVPLIALMEDIAICKAFANGKTVDATQELLAIGVANIGNSFAQAYPGTGSLARSVVNHASGVKTTLGGIYTGTMVIVSLMFLTPYFAFIPKASLAAVIISAIIFMVEFHVIKPMWRSKKTDLIPGLGTFICCLVLPLELGIFIGVAVNIIFILYHAARPKFSVDTLTTSKQREYLMITPDRCLMFPSVDYVRKLVTKFSAGAMPVVIDCTHIYGADFTAAKIIEQLIIDFKAREQPLFFYNLKPSVCAVFEGLTKPEDFVVIYEDEDLERLLGELEAPPQRLKTISAGDV